MRSSKKLKLSRIQSLTLVFLLCLTTQSYAQLKEISSTEPIQIVHYRLDHVMTLQGSHFVATSLQFSKHEKVIGVYIGDQVAWTYAINPAIPYLLFIKPTLDISDTNMAVVTNQHIYHFHLLANKHAAKVPAIYTIQFQYELEVKNKQSASNKTHAISKRNIHTSSSPINSHYIVKGSKAISPVHVFDDGKFTYFKFTDKSTFPAIFMWSNSQKKLVNTQINGNSLIVKCIAKKFLLLKDNEKAWVENNTY